MKARLIVKLFLLLFWCEIHALCATAPRVMAQWPAIPAGQVNNINILGDTLFATIGLGYHAVIDISDSAHPRRVGTIRTEGFRIKTAGPYLLGYSGGRPLEIVDVTERTAPVQIARLDGIYPYAAEAWPIVYAVKAQSTNLITYDFKNPSQPTVVPGVAASGQWSSLSREGNLLVGMTSNGSLWLFDISDPKKPLRGGSYKGRLVGSRGNYLFIEAAGRLEIVDASNVAMPHKIGEWANVDVYDVVAFDETLWVNSIQGVEILDIRNPAEPKSVGSIAALYFSHARNGNDVFLGNHKGVTVFDATNPMKPTIKSEILTAPYYGNANGIGDRLILHNWDGPSPVLDVSDAGSPRPVGQLPASYVSEFVGNKLFLLDTNYVLRLYDGSRLETVQEITRLQSRMEGFSMVSDGLERLFVSASNTIKVVNFSNAGAMTVEGSIDFAGSSVFLARTGTRVVAVANSFNSTIAVIDISNATIPRVTATVTNSTYLIEVATSGNAVYVCGLYDKLFMYEIDAAGGLIERGSLDIHAGHVACTGKTLVTVWAGELKVYDISEPFAPNLTGALTNSPMDLGRVALSASGNIAYVTANTAGLITVQLSGEAPQQPRLNIVNEGEMHRVHWAADFPGYTLFSAPSLNGPWKPEQAYNAGLFNEVALFNEATAGNNAGPRFYELKK